MFPVPLFKSFKFPNSDLVIDCSLYVFSPVQEEEAQIFKNMNLKNHRASCVADEIKYRKQQNITTVGDSVLGQVWCLNFETCQLNDNVS